MDHLKKYITEINDYPKKGIVFKDLNPIYKEPKIWKELMFPLQNLISTKKPDYIAGIESRGCLLYTSPSPRDRTRSRMPSSA